MANYNPNSIWGSKKKAYTYTGKGPQPGSLTGSHPEAAQQPQEPVAHIPTSIPLESGGGRGEKSGGRGLFWFGGGLIVLLAGVGFAVFYFNNHPAPNVAISFITPSQVLVGDPFILTVSYSNNSNQPIANADLSVLLPDGVSFVNATTPGQRAMDQSVASLAAQGMGTETLNLVATGNPNSVDHITATMTYGTSANAATQYQAVGQTDVTVGSSALSFSFNTPASVFSGQNFPIVINYNNESPADISGAQMKISYPSAFTFVSSSIPVASGSGNTLWNLGTIAAGASSSFTIMGTITGPANTPYVLQGTMNGNFQGATYPITTQNANIAVASAPLTIAIALNNSSSYVAAAGDDLNYTLTYTNNSNITFQGVTVAAKLTGSMFDFSKLNSQGSFSSLSNTITWNAASVPALSALSPGESGTLNFSLSTKSAFPIRLVSDKNFVLKILATIQSPTVPPNTAGGNGTQSITELDSKVGASAAIVAKGYYNDISGISDSGPYPPKVNKPTQYTVHWLLTNYSTDLSNVTVSAYLQSGSTFTGVAKSTMPSSTPTYDPTTGLITWSIPFVPATTGVLSKPLEAIFQISNTPAVNQVNQIVTLLGPTTLTATDNFTSSTLTESAVNITTQLPDDASVNSVSNKTVSQ